MKKPSALKELILREGRTQWGICKALHWDEAKLSRFITGRRIPSDADITALAKELDLSPGEVQATLTNSQGKRSLFKMRRRKLFKTQALAAKAMGVSQPTVSAWENGKGLVPEMALKMLDCLEDKWNYARFKP